MSAIDPNPSIDEDEVEMLDAAVPKKRKAEDNAEEPATKKPKAEKEGASEPNVPTAEGDNQTPASAPTVQKTKVKTMRSASSKNIPDAKSKHYNYTFKNTEYFKGVEEWRNYGMIALDKIMSCRKYKPLKQRDADYRNQNAPRDNSKSTPAKDRKVDKPAKARKVVKSLEDLLKTRSKQEKDWGDVDEEKPPMRYICYMPGCRENANDRRDQSRHFNKTNPPVHGDARYDDNSVYGVPHDDWLLDVNLACTGVGTCTQTWYQEFARLGLGPDRLA